jgi:hypothetical protein
VSEFVNVDYDARARGLKVYFKQTLDHVEEITMCLKSSIARGFALEELDKFHMWVDQAIMEDQMARMAEGENRE